MSLTRLRSLWFSLGSLPVRPVTWGLALLFSAWVVLDVLVLQFSSGLAHSTYDAMVRARVFVAAPDPRIVIVDIDEASLSRLGAEFGRWPWPRDTLATVLDHVEKQAPAAVAWDILFSDADRLNPGADAAFNAAVQRSSHSHFSVVRLPASSDSASQITKHVLPTLWVRTDGEAGPVDLAQSARPGASGAIALIPPVLEAVAKAPLGYNNAYVDGDGVLRRYRYADPTHQGGEILQSLPLKLLEKIAPQEWNARIGRIGGLWTPKDELIAWRRHAGTYPRVSFADVFAQAEGGRPNAPVPSFAGKVVIVGATAPSLHDVHPTPLSPVQPGVDSLATAIDNAMNGHRIAELPKVVQAALAIILCLGIALWAQRSSLASLEPALLLLPAALLGVSYVSLNGSPFFVEMHLAAGLALTFLLVLRFWNNLRRNYWCSPPAGHGRLAFWPWLRSEPWINSALDGLIDAVQQHAPRCRVLVLDASPAWPRKLRWPELARYAAVVGPEDELQRARPALEVALKRLARPGAEPTLAPQNSDRETLAAFALREWSGLKTDDPQPRSTT